MPVMIIVALLVLIVSIMLFGAAAVKGFFANAAGAGCAFALLLIPALWLGSFFGEYGAIYAVLGGMGLLLALAIWLKATAAPAKAGKPPVQTYHSRAPSREERKKIRDQLRGR